MLNEFYSQAAVQDDFDVDEEHEKIKAKGAVTKTGDIWKLGDHYLMCGDSTSESDFAKLMQGKRGQMAVTSPPYGVGKDYEKLGIEPLVVSLSATRLTRRFTEQSDVLGK